MKFAPLAAAVATSVLFACAGPSDAQVASGEDDIVTTDTFTRASDIVAGVNYLPFEYKADGCYARALYMSMELATNRIESNALFAFAKDDHPLIVGPIHWVYHVAPLLEVRQPSGDLALMVLDPSISRDPLSQDTWLSDMGFGPGTPENVGPDTLMVPGSDYAPREAKADWQHHNRDVADFQHLPAFKIPDVQNACGVLHAFIHQEPNTTPDAQAAKQAKLIARTESLLAQLGPLGKLATTDAFDPAACAAK